MAKFLTTDEVQRVVNHVFLPPKLPHSADVGGEVALVDITLQALVRLRDQPPTDLPLTALNNAIALITNIKVIHSSNGGDTNEVALRKLLLSLQLLGH
jgi:hypothetical protein